MKENSPMLAHRIARQDTFYPYLSEIDGTNLLTTDEEREIAERIACGDPEARDHLVRANLRLVVCIARTFRHTSLPFEDLVAEGNLGLMRASESFDHSVGARFSTYASYWIKQSIRRSIMNQGKPVRLPAHAVTLLDKWKRASEVLEKRMGRMPSPEEIGRSLNLTERKLRIAIESIRAEECFSMTGTAEQAENGLEVCNALTRHDSPLESLVAKEDCSRLLEALARLDERQAKIIRMRFGLDTGSPATFREIGDWLGLTGTWVHQVEKKALASLMSYVKETAQNSMA
jgi:RNA polymerase primary sigma factor